MTKVLISYYSKSGNTKKMAVRIVAALKESGLSADLKNVDETAPADLLLYDLIVIGSPVYYGTMAWPVKKLLDESVKHHGKLKGKVGGAFTSSGNLAGGNETTVLDILKSLLIHGMISTSPWLFRRDVIKKEFFFDCDPRKGSLHERDGKTSS